MRVFWKTLFALILCLLPIGMVFAAEPGLTAFSVTTQQNGDQTYTLSLQVLVIMTLLTLLPAGLLMMTAFTRIVIVLAILRTAIGTAQAPTNQIIIGLALFMTLFVMAPVFSDVHKNAIKPYVDEQINASTALEKASIPFRHFMMEQTREDDNALFAKISGHANFEKPDDVPMTLLIPAYVTSELKTAFQIGFLLFIPFLIIDLVVASVLMSMGMMMLSPLIISLPFKIMLFVLVDGWSLVLGTLASSFYV